MYEKISDELHKIMECKGWSLEELTTAINVFIRYEYACRLLIEPCNKEITQEDLDIKTDSFMFDEMTQAKKTKLVKRFVNYLKWLEGF